MEIPKPQEVDLLGRRSITTKHWGCRLMLLLRRGGLTQRRLAEMVEVSPMTVSKWIKGGGITDSKLQRLCATLRTTPTWLRWGEQFTDEDIWTESILDPDGTLERKLNSQDKRVMMAVAIELSLGYVTWVMDMQANTVQWSGNASKFFGLAEVVGEGRTLHKALGEYMSHDDRTEAKKIVEKMATGDGSAWLRFRLLHRPNRMFLAIMRSNGEGRLIYGLTVSNSSILGGHISRWLGPSSGSE